MVEEFAPRNSATGFKEWKWEEGKTYANVHFLDFVSGSEEEEEEEFTDWGEEVDTSFNVSLGIGDKGREKKMLDRLKGVESSVFEMTKIRYGRGEYLSERQTCRKRQQERELHRAAARCLPLTSFFIRENRSEHSPPAPNNTIQSPNLAIDEDRLLELELELEPVSEQESLPDQPLRWLSATETRQQNQIVAIAALKKKINSKKSTLTGQNLTRHQAVLAFLYIQQSKRLGETRSQLAYSVARCFNRGWYFARRIITWELTWIKERIIEEGKRGCFSKVRSWLNDEGVQLAVRKWISGAGERKYNVFFVLFWNSNTTHIMIKKPQSYAACQWRRLVYFTNRFSLLY